MNYSALLPDAKPTNQYSTELKSYGSWQPVPSTFFKHGLFGIKYTKTATAIHDYFNFWDATQSC